MVRLWIVALVLGGLFLERAARRRRPLWLAPFAFVPIGRARRVTLSPDRLAELSPQRERPYRTSARDAPDDAELPIGHGTLHRGVRLDGAGQTVALSSPRHYAVARIDVRIRGESATLAARCLPVPLSLLGWAALMLLASRGSLFMTALATLIPIVLGATSYARIRPHVAEAMDEIAAQLER